MTITELITKLKELELKYGSDTRVMNVDFYDGCHVEDFSLVVITNPLDLKEKIVTFDYINCDGK